MTSDKRIAARLAFWSACGCALFALAYDIAQIFEWAGMLGSAGGPHASSTPFGLALLLTPSLLLGLTFPILMAALHRLAPDERKAISQVALTFATIYATLICTVYFTQLTLVAPRIAADDVVGIEPFLFVPYRTFLFAVDLLGYSVMCLATLFAAFALPAGPGARAAGTMLLANGALTPFLALQMYWPWLIWGGALWAITFPAAMVLLARLVRA
jgi:hypothetical protein